ncbi:MAG: hypothetical protein R6X02_14445 [Enhygromyxa sp.]
MRRGTRSSAWLTAGLLAATWTRPVQAGSDDSPQPPVQRPSLGASAPEPSSEAEQAPALEALDAEPESSSEPLEPSAEPLEPGAASIEPSSEPEPGPEPAAPSPAVELPGYDLHSTPESEATPETPRAREVPRDGRGMLTLGGVALAAGGALIAGTVVLAVDGVNADIWASPAIFGAGATLAGSLLVFGGRRRLLAYREWEAAQPDHAPPQGNAMVASGGALLIIGAGSGMFGTISWAMSTVGFQPEGSRVPPVSVGLLGAGLGSLAAGSALMIVGMRRHKRFSAWRSGEGLVIPSVSPLPRGASVGLVGRF